MSRPGYASADSFTSFGDLLKYLRRRAELTQRDLAIAVGYSEPQISYLETNRRLPDVGTVAARFLPVLDLDGVPALGQRLVELARLARAESDPAPGAPPYKGLQYYDETDASLFFGREALAGRLVARLALVPPDRDGPRFLTVVGASGSGKSSILRAAVAPALRRQGRGVRVITPGAHPVTALTGLTADCEVVIVDQFEELFTLCAEAAERERFVQSLLAAACAPDGDGASWVVAGLRADFYSDCAEYAGLREALARRQEYIGPMNAGELRRAIEEPARAGGWGFESGLVDLILRDTGDEPGALPLLSHALLETWTRRRGHTLTVSGYLASGGVRGAIAETAETVFNDELELAQQAVARNIFLRLTELGEGSQPARRHATFDELLVQPGDEAQLQSVLDHLADARLITTSETIVELAHEALIREWPTLRRWLQEDREGILLHRQIASAAQLWGAGGRGTDELYRGLRLARALEWAAAHEGELNLVEQAFVDASRALADEEATELEAQRQRELAAAQRLADAERQRAAESARNAQRLRHRAYALGAALAVVLLLLGTALYLGRRARASAAAAQQNAARAAESAGRAEAEQRVATARELAAAATNNLATDPELGMLLALQAVRGAGSQPVLPEVEQALRRNLAASRLKARLAGAQGAVRGLALAPDGRVATLSEDRTIRVWDPATRTATAITASAYQGQFPVDTGHVLAFGAGGKTLVSWAGDAGLTVWDVATPAALRTLSPGASQVTSVAASPDGKQAAAGLADGTAQIWDLSTGQPLLTLEGSQTRVNDVAFSPDGRYLATAGSDGTVKIWYVASGRQAASLEGHRGTVYSVAFSPDGTQIVTGALDATAKVWDVRTGQLLLTLFGNASLVEGVAFSPDGTQVATAGADGVARVYNAATGEPLLSLAGHASGLNDIAFSADGQTLLTASRDMTVREWDLSPAGSREWLTIGGFHDRVFDAAFSPDAKTYAAASLDGEVVLTNLASGSEVLRFKTDVPAALVRYAPDGKHLAISTDDGVRIWDLATAKETLKIPSPEVTGGGLVYSPDGRYLSWSAGAEITVSDSATGAKVLGIPAERGAEDVAFSPDGKRVAFSDNTDVIRTYDLATGQLSMEYRGSVNTLGIAFNPDGSRLAAAGGDGAVRVWDTSSSSVLLTLTGHSGVVRGVVFTPDGKRLASSSTDRTVKVWTLPEAGAPQEEPITLYGHTAAVYFIDISPDGKYLATASRDGTSRVYLLNLRDLVAAAKARLTRGLTQGECARYLHVSQCPGE